MINVFVVSNITTFLTLFSSSELNSLFFDSETILSHSKRKKSGKSSMFSALSNRQSKLLKLLSMDDAK